MSQGGSIRALQQHLGIVFERVELLQEALTHTSYANETDKDVPHNQRLEFLGDAVLDFVVAHWLFARLPDATEGELTSLRARLVRTESLAQMANDLDLGNYMRFGHGEEASGGRQKVANLCAGFEALIGALFLDQGIAAVERWFVALLECQAAEIDQARQTKDPKSELQEYTQATMRITPRYEVVSVEGPDHARQYTVAVLVGDTPWGTGVGNSKQTAEQSAAHQALETHRE